jgi:hypothetical protein
MKWEEKEIETVKSLIVEGKNYHEIGKILNKSRDSIRYIANKHNFKFEEFNPKCPVECGINERYCGTCGVKKLKSDFNKNKTNKEGLNSICRECSNSRSKKYYSDNQEKHKKAIQERNKKYQTKIRLKIFDYFKDNPCVDCGETNPIVLEFDHKDGVDKQFDLSTGTRRGYKWEKIKNEIDKCDVRCSNCHRIRTAKQFGWYKGFDFVD